MITFVFGMVVGTFVAYAIFAHQLSNFSKRWNSHLDWWANDANTWRDLYFREARLRYQEFQDRDNEGEEWKK